MEFYCIEEFVCSQLDRNRQETGDYLTRENNSKMWNKVLSFNASFFGECKFHIRFQFYEYDYDNRVLLDC